MKIHLHFSFFIFTFSLFVPIVSYAQFFRPSVLLAPYAVNAPDINSRAAVLIDVETGTLLFSKNPHEPIPPASLVKVKTMYLLLNEIKAGRACYDEIIPITTASWAQSQPPRSSLMFLEPGQIVKLREILVGLAVPSGNDAAVATALRLAPTVDAFVELMNEEARRMGLVVTRFADTSGFSPDNLTTAAEFAYFCRRYLRQHPQSLEYFHSIQEFAFPIAANMPAASLRNPQTIVQHNRNSLLGTFPGVDGIKTGFIPQSGFNIALTAERDNTRFLAVTLGAESHQSRVADGETLLSWAFENFKTVRPANIEGLRLYARLWKGRAGSVELIPAHPPYFTSPVSRAQTLTMETFIPAPLVAPLPSGIIIGHLIFSDEYGELHRVSLLTAAASERGNIFRRIWHSILLLFRR